MKKIRWFVTWWLVILMVLTGCNFSLNLGAYTGNGLDNGQVLRITEPRMDAKLDPTVLSEKHGFNVLNNVTESLMRLDQNHRPEPGTAKEYQISDDGKTYTFHLRTDAKWNDGKKVTAHDFAYAWKRLLDPQRKAPLAYVLFGVKNARSYHQSQVGPDKVGIEVANENILVVRLEKPDKDFLNKVALPVLAPQRQDVIEKYNNNYATSSNTMVYNGPFTIITFSPSKLVLMKNGSYWDRGNVSLKMVEIHIIKDKSKEQELYKQGQLESARVKRPAVRNQAEQSRYIESDIAETHYLQMNWNKPLFQNEFIRKALSLAIDRQKISAVLQDDSKPAEGLIPPDLVLDGNKTYQDVRVKSLLSYRPTRAKTYYKKGLKELNLQPSPLRLLVPDDDRKKVAIEIKRQLKENLGIEVLLDNLDGSSRKTEGYDLILDSWTADSNHPGTFIERWCEDYLKINSATINQMISNAQTTTDEGKRLTYITRIEKKLIKSDELAMVVPLYHQGGIYIQKDYVQDLIRHPFGAEYSLKWAYLTID